MRALLWIFFSATFLFGEDPATVAPAVQVPDNLSIPAQISKTVDTNKCKAGDVFEMKTLEPVLISKGIVMPENAKLHGRILGSGSRQSDKPSWIVLVIERAEWKKNSIPLHAFVMSQITVRNQLAGMSSGYDATSPPPNNMQRRRPQRGAIQANPRDDLAISMARPSPEISIAGTDPVQPNYHPLNDVRLMKSKNGTVFLLSKKSHLKLPSGTMLMLRQQPVAGGSASTNATAAVQATTPGTRD